MSLYQPDNWVMIFMNGDDPHYKILAGWSGGYLSGDSWKISSGVVKVDDHDTYYSFTNHSGSVYQCDKQSYGLRMNNAYIWDKLQELHGDKVVMMDENTNWVDMDWILK
jgi:hypothetical protein